MKLFLLPAATLLMANGAYASVRGANTDIDFANLGNNSHQCNFAADQKRTCPSQDFTVQDDGTAVAMGPFNCGTDGNTQLGCCTITASKGEVEQFENGNERRKTEILREVLTFDLKGHGTCTPRVRPGDDIDFAELSAEELEALDDEIAELIALEDEKAAERSNGIEFAEEENRYCRHDSQCRNRNDYCNKNRNRCERASGRRCSQGTDCGNGQGSQWMCRNGRCEPRSLFELAMERVLNGEGVTSVEDMFESELSYGIELDEEELPEFLQLEGHCGCRPKDGDCGHGKYCATDVKCNKSGSHGNTGQCKNKKSLDDEMEELIALEDEKAAERSNEIEFAEEENRRCDRSNQCRRGEFCNRSGHCVRNNNNYCRNQNDCRNRNDYCNTRRNRCERASGRSCSQGTDCGNGRGSQWMCRNGRCEPRSLFELAMERVLNGEAVMFDLDDVMEEE